MRLASFRHGGRDAYGVVVDDEHVVDASQALGADHPTLRTLLRDDGLDVLRELVTSDPLRLALDEVRLLPPVPDPGKILCSGLNYYDHREESGLHDRPEHPTFFTRFADTQVGHGQALVKPTPSDQFDYEGEIALVIGEPAWRIEPHEALAHVAGYSCYNDASARDWQGHGLQWTPGKNFPSTGGFGPYLVTRDEVTDPAALELVVRVNGEERQHASAADLMVGIADLVSYASSFTPLAAGDVIVTGTPAGAALFRTPPPWLVSGDVVEVEVRGVGLLRNPVVEEAQ
jgi:2-keto-4-pentenoate hydratase/2-oxohepta-3-ene-1,7-dioic acid hydratase in catechol pathway